MLRKIKTAEELDKKRRKDQILISVVLISLMVLSTAAYSFLDNGDNDSTVKQKYNNFEFIKSGEYWVTNVQEQNLYFLNLPGEVENVSIVGNYGLQEYSNKILYIVNDNPASQNIILNFKKYYLRVQGACINNETCKDNLPVKNCSDNLIIFIGGEANKVWKQENCVYISGDYFKGSDRFLYKAFGIL